MRTNLPLADQVKWHAYIRAKSVQWYIQARAGRVILGRVACLGRDVLKQLAPTGPIVNLQKGRIDYIADCDQDHSLRARAAQLVPHVGREAVVQCIAQEELVGAWLSTRRPRVLFMDSMAELGDQLFTNRSHAWRFLSAYTDISHSEAFRGTFVSNGLLPIPQLREQFRRFLGCMRDRFGDIPIFYLHFPSTLEPRESFRIRHVSIREALEAVAPAFGSVVSLAVDDAIVSRPEDVQPDLADFAYHYNHATYVRFADLVRERSEWQNAVAQAPRAGNGRS